MKAWQVYDLIWAVAKAIAFLLFIWWLVRREDS
jgi:hypothetical protein